MEWMPCHECGVTGIVEAADDFRDHEFAVCESGCRSSGVCIVNDGDSDDISLVAAWNALQTKLARLELLEAMLKDRQPTKTKGRL